MGDRLATIDMDRKLGGCANLGQGELLPHLTHCGLWAKAYPATKWHLDPSSRLATTDMSQKLGAVPFLGRASWFPIGKKLV